MNRFSTGVRSVLAVVAFASMSLAAGCATSTPPPVATVAPQLHAHTHDPSDHNHARGKMLMASNGFVSALLTSHLAPSGNELDIFVEDRGGPRALALASVTAQATGAGATKPITFECAPADERPTNEASGTCSHFVAKVPWMKNTDTLMVTSTVAVDGKDVSFVWRDFGVRRYAHHEE